MSDESNLRIRARRAEAEGDYARASRLYREAVSAARDEGALPDAALLVRLADLEQRQDDAEAALTYYRRAVEVYAEQGLLTNAVAVCNKILRVFPDAHEWHAHLADLYLDLGITAEARQHMLEYDRSVAESRGPEAVDVDRLRAFLGREPDQEVALQAARRLDTAGRSREALELLRRAWRERVRDDLEVDALERGARELGPGADPRTWSPEGPGVRAPATDREEEGATAESGTAEVRGGLGHLGVLAEVDETADPSCRVHIVVLQTLARLIEYRDFETEWRAEGVGELAGRIGEELGLAEPAVRLLGQAAPLHDVGMVVVPDRVLLKKGDLTDEEREIMKTHAANGARILEKSDLPVMRLASEIARTHHERWDGDGYPRGLEGEEIPLSGRIVAAADAFEALTHDRPFRDARSRGDALEAIRRERGTHFDPRVVDALVDVEGAGSSGDDRQGSPQQAV